VTEGGSTHRSRRDTEVDDRPPICQACGVTMGLVVEDGDRPRYICLECGFDESGLWG
jgi:hypothetical protein